MSRVLISLRECLASKGLGSSMHFQHSASISCCEVSYIDDVAIPVLASASELIQKTSETAAIAVDVFLCYAMQLNLLRISPRLFRFSWELEQGLLRSYCMKLTAGSFSKRVVM